MDTHTSASAALDRADCVPVAQGARERPLAKAALWPRPNYRRLVRDGFSAPSVRLLAFLYDWVPKKPLVALPNAQLYYETAVRRFGQSAQHWLEANRARSSLGISDFSNALSDVLRRCWGFSEADPAYFSARFERSPRGCEIHVMVGSSSPFKRVPTHKAFDSIHRQLVLGWPAPRPPHERKRVFVVPLSSITMDAQGGLVRYRWPLSASSDRGYLCCFADQSEAREWFRGLPPFLVITDRASTRLLSSHDDAEGAHRFATSYALSL